MYAAVRSLTWNEGARTEGAGPEVFSWRVRLIAGPSDGPGEESFDLVVCTPEWLAHATRQQGRIFDGRHHVVVNLDSFDRNAVEAWITKRVTSASGEDWSEVGEKLSRLGYWEFEDYAPHRG